MCLHGGQNLITPGIHSIPRILGRGIELIVILKAPES